MVQCERFSSRHGQPWPEDRCVRLFGRFDDAEKNEPRRGGRHRWTAGYLRNESRGTRRSDEFLPFTRPQAIDVGPPYRAEMPFASLPRSENLHLEVPTVLFRWPPHHSGPLHSGSHKSTQSSTHPEPSTDPCDTDKCNPDPLKRSQSTPQPHLHRAEQLPSRPASATPQASPPKPARIRSRSGRSAPSHPRSPVL